jgi:hypothetical protein
MQKVVLAITFPHFFLPLYLHSLLSLQKLNYTSLMSHYAPRFNILKIF